LKRFASKTARGSRCPLQVISNIAWKSVIWQQITVGQRVAGGGVCYKKIFNPFSSIQQKLKGLK